LTSRRFLLFRKTIKNFLDCLAAAFSEFRLKRMTAHEKIEKKRRMTSTNCTTGLAVKISLKTFIITNLQN
jgi:hypothetical protein